MVSNLPAKEKGTAVSESETRNWCWPWAHRWTQWQVIDKGDNVLVNADTGKTLVKSGSFETQRRECTICKISQLRKECTYS